MKSFDGVMGLIGAFGAMFLIVLGVSDLLVGWTSCPTGEFDCQTRKNWQSIPTALPGLFLILGGVALLAFVVMSAVRRRSNSRS